MTGGVGDVVIVDFGTYILLALGTYLVEGVGFVAYTVGGTDFVVDISGVLDLIVLLTGTIVVDVVVDRPVFFGMYMVVLIEDLVGSVIGTVVFSTIGFIEVIGGAVVLELAGATVLYTGGAELGVFLIEGNGLFFILAVFVLISN
jgi:hypothetical protein